MKFDINNRILNIYKDLYYEKAGMSEYVEGYMATLQLNNNFGPKVAKKLNQMVENNQELTKQDLQQIKADFFDFQNHEKKYQVEYCLFDGDDSLFNVDQKTFDDMMLKSPSHVDSIWANIDLDTQVLTILRGMTSQIYRGEMHEPLKTINNETFLQRQTDLGKIIKEYIEEGYNIYPLLRQLNKAYEKCKDADKQKSSKLKCSMQIIQINERFSPYKYVFDYAQKIGSLALTCCPEKSKQVRSKVLELQNILAYRIKKDGFDITELKDIVLNKAKFLNESNKNVYGTKNRDLYVGLQVLYTDLHNDLSVQK